MLSVLGTATLSPVPSSGGTAAPGFPPAATRGFAPASLPSWVAQRSAPISLSWVSILLGYSERGWLASLDNSSAEHRRGEGWLCAAAAAGCWSSRQTCHPAIAACLHARIPARRREPPSAL